MYFDHGYTLIGAGRERVWVGEPYDLTVSDMRALVRWASQGWQVCVRAWGAVHFPGHTLRVNLWRGPLTTPEPEP